MSAMVWTFAAPLILASGSATRRTMLEDAGIAVEVRTADIDERAIDAPLREKNAPPREIALALAREKALAVSRDCPGRLVLGADQILDCEGRIFDKAPDRDAALRKLAMLQGLTHILTSAAAIALDRAILFETASEARLTMRPLDSDALALYAHRADLVLTRSVGCYEIEGLGAHLFSRVEGDHFTIRGLPLLELLAGFRAKGWIAL